MRREAPHDAVGAPDEDEVLAEADAVGRAGPQLHPLVEQPPVVELAEQPRLGDGVRAVPHLAAPARHVAEVVVPLGPNSIEKLWLQFWLEKKHLSFGLRFPTLGKCSKIGSLDISRHQNGISIRFSSQNSSQTLFY